MTGHRPLLDDLAGCELGHEHVRCARVDQTSRLARAIHRASVRWALLTTGTGAVSAHRTSTGLFARSPALGLSPLLY